MRTMGQRKSRLQENRVAKDLDGRRVKASGATDFQKGDVRAKGVRVECKTTSTGSYRLTLVEWRKIQKEAAGGFLDEPAMQIEFQGAMGQNRKLAVIDWHRYVQLRGLEES